MNTDQSSTYTAGTSGSSSTGGSSTAASLKDDAAQLKDTAKTRLADEADARKGQVAQGMKQVSSALDAARSDLDDSDTPDWLKSGLRRVASSVSSLADELESKDSGQLARDVRSFARGAALDLPGGLRRRRFRRRARVLGRHRLLGHLLVGQHALSHRPFGRPDRRADRSQHRSGPALRSDRLRHRLAGRGDDRRHHVRHHRDRHQRRGVVIEPTPDHEDASVVDLLKTLTDQGSHLATQQVALVKAEMQESLIDLKVGITALVGAAVVGIAGLGVLLMGLGYLLGVAIDSVSWGLIIVAVITLIVAYIMYRGAAQKMSATELTPERTQRTLERTPDAAAGNL